MHAEVEQITASIPQRLAECAEKAGGKRALSQATGISEAQLFRYISGVADIPAHRLIAIALAADVAPGWLLTGDAPARSAEECQPPFREALLTNITQTLEELLIEYEKNFTPAQRAKAISFMYKALRHEEVLRGEPLTITKPLMLGFVNFLVDIRHEDTLTALSHAIDFFEYSPKSHHIDYAAHAGEFSAFVNFIIRAYEHYYNSATGRAYFDRLGSQILPHTAKQLDAVIAHVQECLGKSGLSVLDLGCGSGRDASYMHRHYRHFDVQAVDQSQSSINICKELEKKNYLAEGSVHHSDMRALPFENERFDLISSRQALYCLPYLKGSGLGVESFMQEVRRTLVSGGYFYVVSRCGSGTEYLPFCQNYNKATFTQLASEMGFDVVWFEEQNTRDFYQTGCRHLQSVPQKYDLIFRALLKKK